jgi:hypothetical protein
MWGLQQISHLSPMQLHPEAASYPPLSTTITEEYPHGCTHDRSKLGILKVTLDQFSFFHFLKKYKRLYDPNAAVTKFS